MSERVDEMFVKGAAHDGISYDASSQTQRAQGEYLLSLIPTDLQDGSRMADIGCGNGKTTLDICRSLGVDATVLASDLSASQIEVAQTNLALARQETGSNLPDNITFYVAGALDIGSSVKTSNLDLVVSNAALHWIKNGHEMYGRIYDALDDDGEIVIQQGGQHCYAGLAKIGFDAAGDIGLGEAFEDWEYPLFYPSRQEMTEILGDVGFRKVKVESLESDGSQYPTLYANYADAGILPFVECAGDKGDGLRSRYLEIAAAQQASGDLDGYTHMLVITAQK